MSQKQSIPSVTVNYAGNGSSTKANEMGMRVMQERAYEKRGEQYLLIKSPPASGKSRALMFIALDKLQNQGVRKAIVVVPEKGHRRELSQRAAYRNTDFRRLGSRAAMESLQCSGRRQRRQGELRQNLPGRCGSVLVCTHATFRFAVDRFGVEIFDGCLVAVDEFHHVSANPDNKLGDASRPVHARDKVHIVAMTGSYFRGDADPVLSPHDESKFETVTYTYYEQLTATST